MVSGQQNYAAKKQAAELVAEARGLASQGHLAEARAKAVEADKIPAIWAPDEDSPGFVLRDLDTRASMRIKLLIDQASDTVAKNPTDPTRFQKADTYLLTARRLAESFRQDTTPIDIKIQWLQQVASQSRANPSVAGGPAPQSAQVVKNRGAEESSDTGSNGPRSETKELLIQARREGFPQGRRHPQRRRFTSA